MPDNTPRVLTVGHSTLPFDTFFTMLEGAGVTVIADVRSAPVSGRAPHFNRDELRLALRARGIDYVFLGKELGGRPRANRLYSNGVADYERMALEREFSEGLQRVTSGAQQHTVALMCSEHDPLDCHRCLLVGRALSERDVDVGNILSDGSVVDQSDVEEKLLAMAGRSAADLFADRKERLADAYRLRAKKVAHHQTRPDFGRNRDELSA